MASTIQERKDSATRSIPYASPWRSDAIGRIAPEWSRDNTSHVRVTVVSRLPIQVRSDVHKNSTESSEKSPDQRFNRLVAEWKSSVKKARSLEMKIAMHQSYQRMIGMGDLALPFILERLKVEPENSSHWFWALSSIAEENPVPKEARGKLREMTKAWLKWGSEKGYVKLD
jgi:hypothetical protein